MIRVNRGDAPQAFADRADGWRAQLAHYRQQKPAITAAAVWGKVRGEIGADASILAERFHHKCAYCEARPGHVCHPHVEHYRPKGLIRFENKMFDWDNWLLSCGICNQEKWKHFPEEVGKPLHHLGFEIAYIFGGVFCKFRPDYLIRLRNGTNLVSVIATFRPLLTYRTRKLRR